MSSRSPAGEKIALFRSLFRGREDVFPKRWENSRTGKTGYALACGNEWKPRLCGKPRVKCGACPNQAFLPMTDEVITGHLRGRHTIGVYPMLADGTCWFLAADFDKETWQQDVNTFLDACRSRQVPAAVERSRSGNGGHVWIFFAEPVPTSLARRLGALLLTEAMECNPPFNVSDWGGERLSDDKRWRYGTPPKGNANFAWVQHIVHHLAPRGTAGFVLANGSMSSSQSGEGEIRKNLIEAGLVDCMVALPGQLFYSTQIPACLWFLARERGGGRFRDRAGEILFVDARALGRMVDRTHREFTDEDIARIADTYHAWRGGEGAGAYADVPGFCKSAALEEVRKHGHVLTPGRYVGAAPQEDDGEPFEDKMERFVKQLREQQAEGARLDKAIEANLKTLGFGDGGS